MCGRCAFFASHGVLDRLAKRYGITVVEDRYNVAPGQFMPVVVAGDDGMWHPELMRWGLIPGWAKEESFGFRTINARAETVAAKPAFRASFRRRRCLVPASGFYEWRREGSAKAAHFLTVPDRDVITFAGLWDNWTNPASGEDLHTYTILTMDATDDVRPVHDRMPVILGDDAEEAWIDPDASADELSALLESLRGHEPPVHVERVSDEVNNARHEGAHLIVPIA